MKTKILLIDDDLTLLHLLGQYLRESAFDVIEASSGPTGLRLAYGEKPDLVLLDVMLPGRDGWEGCTRLRELTDLPIIMLTAKTTEADKLRGFHLGVDDYVTKPFSFAELVARIQAVIGRVCLQFSSQHHHISTDKRCITSAITPDFAHQIFVRSHFALAPHKDFEQPKFGRCQFKGPATE